MLLSHDDNFTSTEREKPLEDDAHKKEQAWADGLKQSIKGGGLEANFRAFFRPLQLIHFFSG